jgi:hypothetical protein
MEERMLDPRSVTNEVRARVRVELPEVEEIRDPSPPSRKCGTSIT